MRILRCNARRNNSNKKWLINFIKSIGSALYDHFKVVRWNLPSFIDRRVLRRFYGLFNIRGTSFANENISTYLNSSPLITGSVTHSHFFISILPLFAIDSFAKLHTNYDADERTNRTGVDWFSCSFTQNLAQLTAHDMLAFC